jgi:hypothetical protein
MTTTIRGVVQNGFVVPESPLPEGAHVEIHQASKATDDDPLAPARARGKKARETLLATEGPALTARQVARRLKMTAADVEQRRHACRFLAVDVGKHEYLYPRWQFTDQDVLAGLEKILAALRDFDPWTQLSFFLSGNFRLSGETPLHALRRGKVEAVRRAARAYGEQGAG